jgi:hypothetical protein
MGNTIWGVWNWTEQHFMGPVGSGPAAHQQLAELSPAREYSDMSNDGNLSVELACERHPAHRWGSCEPCAAEYQEATP